MSGAKSLDEKIDNQIIVLKVYGRKAEGRSEDSIEIAEFMKAYSEAAHRLGREKLIEP